MCFSVVGLTVISAQLFGFAGDVGVAPFLLLCALRRPVGFDRLLNLDKGVEYVKGFELSKFCLVTSGDRCDNSYV